VNADERDRRLEQAMGNLLRVGVIIAAAVVLLGGVIYLARHGHKEQDYRIFKGVPPELREPVGIFDLALDFSGRGLIMLGLLVLISTPVARVAFSALGFVWERDWFYVAATLTVLTVLLLSFFTHE
jgi:uncharacterized membrane protein